MLIMIIIIIVKIIKTIIITIMMLYNILIEVDNAVGQDDALSF